MASHERVIDRRDFLKSTAAGLGAVSIVANGQDAQADQPAKVDDKHLIRRNIVPTMEYQRLGRTNYLISRIVQGRGGDSLLWTRLMANGVNYWDTARCYGNEEVELAPFLKKHRDQIWLTSKSECVTPFGMPDPGVFKLYRAAMQDFLGESEGEPLLLHRKAIEKQNKTGQKPDLRPVGRRIAEVYLQELDESLGRTQTDHFDAYYVHGCEIPWLFDCVEVWDAFEKAQKAGKVKHFGLSTHNHQKEVLAATVEANKTGPWKIDLVMAGVNPESFRGNERQGQSFDHLRPELEALKKQDVGLIAMKTTGIRNRPVDGREKRFESVVGGKKFNEYERAKLWMLHLTEGLVDACICSIKSYEEMERNLELPGVKLSSAAKRELDALVMVEMAGACHLCGNCQTNCPEHIAVTDMIRYHAYHHQYGEKELARELYRRAGYDPASVCSNCGKCHDACQSGVPIVQILHQLSAELG